MDNSSAIYPETAYNGRVAVEIVRGYLNTIIYLSVIYLAAVHLGKSYMKDRSPMDLRRPLLLWSTLLAVFSIVGAARTLPEFWHSLSNGGLQYSICSFNYFDKNQTSGFWSFLFVLSKVAELFDTLFIVLRKKNLVFLHWYHHFTVMVYVWYLVAHEVGAGRWFMNMNYCVHSIMYTYYAITAAEIKLPRKVAFIITSAQILQMIGGMFVGFRMLQYWWTGEKCNLSGKLVFMTLAMYLSYLILFLNFFVQSYIKPPSRRHTKVT